MHHQCCQCVTYNEGPVRAFISETAALARVSIDASLLPLYGQEVEAISKSSDTRH